MSENNIVILNGARTAMGGFQVRQFGAQVFHHTVKAHVHGPARQVFVELPAGVLLKGAWKRRVAGNRVAHHEVDLAEPATMVARQQRESVRLQKAQRGVLRGTSARLVHEPGARTRTCASSASGTVVGVGVGSGSGGGACHTRPPRKRPHAGSRCTRPSAARLSTPVRPSTPELSDSLRLCSSGTSW
mgnify:CR=1 FL=1